MFALTADQIAALAPDASSLSAGREQARGGKWQGLGEGEGHVWGLVQGSGKVPYQTVVELAGPAFHCSCPSRKFPCKHGLGLLLLRVGQAFGEAAPPAWVADWQTKRGGAATKKATAAAKPVDEEDIAAREAAAAKRAGKRLATMSAGLEQTRQWLEDLVQHGLAWAQAQPDAYWREQAARLVNAQCPGAAKLVEDCAAHAHSGDGAPARLLAQLARLWLLCRAWPQRDALPAPARAGLLTAAGLSTPQEAVLANPGVQGTWQVLARVAEEDGALRRYRHWLWCHEHGVVAQVLHFAAGSQPLDPTLVPNLVFDGELVYFDDDASPRALVKSRQVRDALPALLPPAFAGSLAATWVQAQRTWCAQPWLPQVPLAFTATPVPEAGGFVDAAGDFLAWERGFPNGWLLAAMSGGAPLQVFGEQTAEGFSPLTVFTAEGVAWQQPNAF